MEENSAPDSPPFNPMGAFLDDLLQPAVDLDDSIHGTVSEFHLSALSSPLLLLQDVGPGYKTPRVCALSVIGVVGKHGLRAKYYQIT